MAKIYWDGRIKIRQSDVLAKEERISSQYIRATGEVDHSVQLFPNIFHDGWVEYFPNKQVFEVFLIEERPYLKTGPNTHADKKAVIALSQIRALGPIVNGHLFSLKFARKNTDGMLTLLELIFEGTSKDVQQFSDVVKKNCTGLIKETQIPWEATARAAGKDTAILNPIAQFQAQLPQPSTVKSIQSKKHLNYLFSGGVIISKQTQPAVVQKPITAISQPSNPFDRNIFQQDPFTEPLAGTTSDGRSCWTCRLCDVEVYSKDLFEGHIYGKKHKKLLGQWYRSHEKPKESANSITAKFNQKKIHPVQNVLQQTLANQQQTKPPVQSSNHVMLPAPDMKVLQTLKVLQLIKLQDEKKKEQEKSTKLEQNRAKLGIAMKKAPEANKESSDNNDSTVAVKNDPTVKTEGNAVENLKIWQPSPRTSHIIFPPSGIKDEESIKIESYVENSGTDETEVDEEDGGIQWTKIEPIKPENGIKIENGGKILKKEDGESLRRYCSICNAMVLQSAWNYHIIGVEHKLKNYELRMRLAAGQSSIIGSVTYAEETNLGGGNKPVKKSTLQARKRRERKKAKLYANVAEWRKRLEKADGPKDYEEGYGEQDYESEEPEQYRKKYVKSGPRKRKAPGLVTKSSIRDQMENPNQHVLHCPQCDMPIGDDKMMDAHEKTKAHRHMTFKKIVEEVSAIPWKHRMVHRDVWFASGLGDAFHEKTNEFFVEMDRKGNDYELYTHHPYCMATSGEHHYVFGKRRRH